MSLKFEFDLNQVISRTPLEILRRANKEVNLDIFHAVFKNYFPLELELLKKIGVAPDSGAHSFFDPFGSHAPVTDDFSNIGEHCIAVAACSMLIAQYLGEDVTKGSNLAREAINRALLHDALKPWEIFLARAFKNNKISREDYYLESIFDRVIEVLVSLGLSLSQAEALVRDYGSECDVRECFGYFLRVGAAGEVVLKSGDIAKKIVHLADNMTCSVMPVAGNKSQHYFLTTSERLILSEADKRYPWALKAGIVVSQDGTISHTSDSSLVLKEQRVLYNIHEALIALSHVIAQELMPLNATPDQSLKSGIIQSLSLY